MLPVDHKYEPMAQLDKEVDNQRNWSTLFKQMAIGLDQHCVGTGSLRDTLE